MAPICIPSDFASELVINIDEVPRNVANPPPSYLIRLYLDINEEDRSLGASIVHQPWNSVMILCMPRLIPRGRILVDRMWVRLPEHLDLSVN